LGGLACFFISNFSRSNFANSHVELDFEKANKEGSRETNPIGRVCNDMIAMMQIASSHIDNL